MIWKKVKVKPYSLHKKKFNLFFNVLCLTSGSKWFYFSHVPFSNDVFKIEKKNHFQKSGKDWKSGVFYLFLALIVPWLTTIFVILCKLLSFDFFSPACRIASSSTGSSSLTSPQHSALARVNQAAAAAAAANAAIAASRRGSYPLNAVAALTAAQQRNLAAMANTTSAGLTGSTGTMVSAESAISGPPPQQQHAATASPLTAVAAQQLHGLTQ